MAVLPHRLQRDKIMRKIKEIIEEIQLLGKANFEYFDLGNDLGQRPSPYKIFSSVQKFMDNRSFKGEQKIRIARELIEIGVYNSKNSTDLSYLAFLIADCDRDLKDVEWARQVIKEGMIKFNSKDDHLVFARIIGDKDAINDKGWAAEIYAGIANSQENVDDLIFSASSALGVGDKNLAKDVLYRAVKSVSTIGQISQIINFIGTGKNKVNDQELLDKLLSLPVAKCQNFHDASELTDALSISHKLMARDYFNVMRKYISSGFDVERAIYIAGEGSRLGDKNLAKEVLSNFLKSDYSFDEWYSILRPACWQIEDESLNYVIVQKCVDVLEKDDVDRNRKFKMLSEFVRDHMRDIKLSKELDKKSKKLSSGNL